MYVSENPNRPALTISDKNSEAGFTSLPEPEGIVTSAFHPRVCLAIDFYSRGILRVLEGSPGSGIRRTYPGWNPGLGSRLAGTVWQSITEERPKGTPRVAETLHFQLREGMNNLLISHALLAREQPCTGDGILSLACRRCRVHSSPIRQANNQQPAG